MGRLTGLLGLITMLALAYLFSSNRRAIKAKTVVMGLVLQFLFGFNEWLHLRPEIKMSTWITFALMVSVMSQFRDRAATGSPTAKTTTPPAATCLASLVSRLWVARLSVWRATGISDTSVSNGQ